MIIRIDPELKARVNAIVKSEGKSISEVVRELFETYARDRDIGLYIDDLWKCIGTKLSSRGFGPGESALFRKTEESNSFRPCLLWSGLRSYRKQL